MATVALSDLRRVVGLAELTYDRAPDEAEALDRTRAACLTPSSQDGPAWMELLAAATDALRHGEHDGDCWPRHWDEDVCELHVSTQRDRYARLAAAVDALKVP